MQDNGLTGEALLDQEHNKKAKDRLPSEEVVTAGWRHKTLGSAAAPSPMNFWLGRETPCKEFCNKALED